MFTSDEYQKLHTAGRLLCDKGLIHTLSLPSLVCLLALLAIGKESVPLSSVALRLNWSEKRTKRYLQELSHPKIGGHSLVKVIPSKRLPSGHFTPRRYHLLFFPKSTVPSKTPSLDTDHKPHVPARDPSADTDHSAKATNQPVAGEQTSTGDCEPQALRPQNAQNQKPSGAPPDDLPTLDGHPMKEPSVGSTSDAQPQTPEHQRHSSSSLLKKNNNKNKQ